MDKSFRCTNEILNYSLKFIEHNPGIKSFNRQGDAPEIHAASDPSALSGMILKEVNTCMEKGYRSIGLICKSERNALRLFDSLKDKIDLQLIKTKVWLTFTACLSFLSICQKDLSLMLF